LTDYSPQLETSGSAPRRTEFARSTSSVFGEDEEVELASEFLEIASERDLDHFIGELTDRASSAMDSDLDEPVERDLGGIFKGIRPSQADSAPDALAAQGSERRKRRVPACGDRSKPQAPRPLKAINILPEMLPA
jgi:hypothetical protein